jgi:oxepin-CoA hydrolase/3-oxo-5,6-dehydrosuberyl-CoA semialdehyde dehydrogenase
MGPVATADQLRDVRAGIAGLAGESDVLLGGAGPVKAHAPEGKGYFVAPTLLWSRDPRGARLFHEHEVFGPVATICGCSSQDVAQLVARGGGSLVCSVYTDDRDLLRSLVLAVAPWHGRVYLGSEKIAGQTFGPGTVLPQLVHGGPGHAGSGEELGGLRGLQLYSQRVALQGDRALLDHVLS